MGLIITVTRSLFKQSLPWQPRALSTLSSLLSVILCQCPKYKFSLLWNEKSPALEPSLCSGMQRLQTLPAPSPTGKLQRDGAATSHSLFSLQLIFLKYRSQSFPETLEQGSPVTHFVVGSWMWHCSKSSTSSVLPGLTLGSEIPGTQLRAWLFQERVFINIYPVQRESQLVLNQ